MKILQKVLVGLLFDSHCHIERSSLTHVNWLVDNCHI